MVPNYSNGKKGIFPIFLMVSIVVIFSLVIAGCSGQAGKPTNGVVNGGKPDAGQAGQVGSNNQKGIQHEKVKIDIYSAQVGPSYAVSFALAEIINKNHPWIQASAVETRGSTDNILTVSKNPELRKRTLFIAGDYDRYAAIQALPPYKEKISDIKAVAFSGGGGMYFITLDSGIKTMQDLKGKRVVTERVGSGKRTYAMHLLTGAGLADQIKEVNTPIGEGKDLLVNNQADALFTIATFAEPGKANQHEAVIDLMSTKKVFFIPLSNEIVSQTVALSGINYSYYQSPPGEMDPSSAQPLGTMFWSNMWAAFPEFDAEVAYEIVKLIYEHANEFKSYHISGAAITPERVSWLNVEDESAVHPGALKYFQEQSIKMGLPKL